MTPNNLIAALMLAGGLTMSTAAFATAPDCPAPDDPYSMDDAAVLALYDCIKDAMAAGYAKAGDPVGSNYRNWTVSSTRPGISGVHGERFLQTFVNDIGAAQYLKFATDGVKMPVGTVIAKESFKIKKKTHKAVVGPLFTMTKVPEGQADEYDNWVYGMLLPNGKPMKVKQSYCNDCHAAYEGSDALAYPLEEVRVKSGD